MNSPRFADTDFLAHDETADSETSLGISERGMELLHKINELIDLATNDQPNGPDQPIIVQYTQG